MIAITVKVHQFSCLQLQMTTSSVGNRSLKWELINQYLWTIDLSSNSIGISNSEIQKWYILAHKNCLPSINKQYCLAKIDVQNIGKRLLEWLIIFCLRTTATHEFSCLQLFFLKTTSIYRCCAQYHFVSSYILCIIVSYIGRVLWVIQDIVTFFFCCWEKFSENRCKIYTGLKIFR